MTDAEHSEAENLRFYVRAVPSKNVWVGGGSPAGPGKFRFKNLKIPF